MAMTVITDEARETEAELVDGAVLIDPAYLPTAIGWDLKPEGLCRGDVCMPVRDRDVLYVDERVDLARVAEALDRPFLVEDGVAALGEPRAIRRMAAGGLQAPEFALPDLDGRVRHLGEWQGKKKLLVTFATWCGCRHDLPGWQALQDELADTGLQVIATALDEDAERVRPYAEGIEFPVLVDREHTLSETYAITNVPTVVWIDEDEHIVRPNTTMFGDDTWVEFTGVSSEPSMAAIRRWARDGEVDVSPDEARAAVEDLSPELEEARLRFRIGAHLARTGDTAGAERQLTRATELAPDDLTIWRAAMPLLGDDPFGEAFFAKFEEWQARGAPFNGLAPMT
jgi:peroxiredoxin